ncbi:PaaI family thioesterase [Pseudorhodoferax sp. Leaf265]|uniref:PaaI family thioesterase n=1 Tax=Pseudorhodoferax sp. Leaf265 TaxID=1736315 RepID=UPI0006FBFEE5|nr:PaaI family thioesterase [Pseudorhodoferax sp. Leaf265]KQP19193.1 phenylacetic acid degradation protein [Pseudorhodoferax sp. Leaf265]
MSTPIQQLFAVPFIDHLGIRLTRFEDGQSEMRYEAKPEHLNNFHVTHGGACMTLLDVTMAAAARSLRPEMGVLTIEMKTSFMQSARGPLIGIGKVLQATGRMAFTEARIEDQEGRLCAHATGTFKYIPRAPAMAEPPSD